MFPTTALTLALLVQAPTPTNFETERPTSTTDWNDPVELPGKGAATDRSVLGEINGDDFPDVVVHRGDDLVVFSGAGVFTSVSSVVATGITDFDVIRNGAGGGRDSLVASTSSGIVLVEWNSTSSLYVGTMVIDANRASSPFVRSGDFDGDGLADILTVGTDLKTYYVSLGTGMGGYAAPTQFSIVPTASAVHVMDFRPSDPGDEIVIGSEFGLRVVGHTGPPFVAKLHNSQPNDVLTSLERSGALDVLFWVTGSTTDQILLNVTDSGSMTPNFSPPVSLPGSDFVSAVAADLWTEGSGSLNVELMLNDSSAGQLVTLQQDLVASLPPGGFYPYDVAGAEVFDYSGGGTPATNGANPVAADLDGDQLVDLAFVTEHLDRFDFWTHGAIPDGVVTVPVAGSPIYDALSVVGADEDLGSEVDATQTKLHVAVTPPTGTDYYRVITWSQPEVDDELDPVATNAYDADLQFTGSSNEITYIDVIVPRDDSDAYFLSLQPRDTNDEPLGRWFHGGFAETGENATPAGNSEVDPAGENIEQEEVTLIGDGKVVTPSFLPTRGIPRFPIGTAPVTNVSEVGDNLPEHDSLATVLGQ